MDTKEYIIRQAKISDMDDLYDICIRTGNYGEDARNLYNNHVALGIYYVGPYVALEQDLAFVLEDKLGICGYVLGTKDTKIFFKKMTEEWLPKYQTLFPMPEGDPEIWNMDLLPRARKKGNGRIMIETMHKKLKILGIKGVFLDVGINNLNAQSFYEKIGYKKLQVTPSKDGLFMIHQL